MNYKKTVFVVVFFLLATNIFWIYIFVDQSISYDHIRSSFNRCVGSMKLNKKLLLEFGEKVSVDKNQFEKKFKDRYPDYLFKEENGVLFVDSTGLIFKDGKLVDIIYDGSIDQ